MQAIRSTALLPKAASESSEYQLSIYEDGLSRLPNLSIDPTAAR